MNNLPPILPSSTPAGNSSQVPRPGGWNRAQNFSTGKLQQHTDREKAAVSIHQAINRDTSHGSTHTTSINHSDTKATTSISRPAQEVHSINGDQEMYDKGSDDRRYTYIRKLIRARKEKEKLEASKPNSKDPYKISVGTGASFTKGTREGFDKQLKKFFYRNRRSTFANVSKEDQQILNEVITKRASTKRTGKAWTRIDKKMMNKQVGDAYRSGTISKEDRKDFKKIIDKLD